MKMSDLMAYGYPSDLIKIWEREESGQLLPIQQQAIEKHNVFDEDSPNLLVIAPTSAGKTFIGELASVKQALELKRAIFLVPYRAIAEELYAKLVRKYHEYGLHIVIADRDHHEYDGEIASGNYAIAVVVYEKLTSLLVAKPEIISGCSLVIADEVQMVMDKDRGPDIELLLTKLLLSQRRVRLITLSAVLDRLNGFDIWLKAQVLLERCRPVELREGLYRTDGQVEHVEFNSALSGVEQHRPWEQVEQGLVNIVQEVIDNNEQVLVFCATRQSTMSTAQMLAGRLTGTTPAVESIRRANELTDSATREELQNLLRSGIAYHNSDLALDERLLIEEEFRCKDIKVVTCTSTLAMGVNVPARNVVICDPRKWNGKDFVPISVGEYKNMAGRAGRYSAGDAYGRSFLLAESRARADILGSMYIRGKLEGFTSSFGDQAIDSQVLGIIAGGYANTYDTIREFILSTFNGRHKWTTDESKRGVNKLINDAVTRCLDFSAVEQKESLLVPTLAGRLCATGGHSLKHLHAAQQYLSTYSTDIDASIIYWSLETLGAEAYHIGRVKSDEFRSGKYQHDLANLASECPVGPLLDDLASFPNRITYEQCVTLRRFLACHAWISLIPTRQIEKQFPGVAVGAIRNTAEQCARLITFVGELSKALYPNQQKHLIFQMLAERLLHGSTEQALDLCRIRHSGLWRDDRNHLVKVGIQSIDDVLAYTADKLPLPRNKALRLINAAEQTISDNMERRQRQQLTRLTALGMDISLLKKLYEAQGKDLELVIDDLLKPPFLKLTCPRVTTQNDGDPDHLLYRPDGGVVAIQTTARENKNVAMVKATSVIGQSSKYKPVGYIVFGRPDFDVSAIKDCPNQISSGRNYKLIPIPVLAEMYVRFSESKIGSDTVQHILLESVGYIGFEELEDIVEQPKYASPFRGHVIKPIPQLAHLHTLRYY